MPVRGNIQQEINEANDELNEYYSEENEITNDIIMRQDNNNQQDVKNSVDFQLIGRNNLLNVVQKTTHTLRIKKEITPVKIEEGEIWCPKCGGKRVLRTQAQTRSGDEAMTAFFRCANPEKHCRHKWKVN